MKSPLTTNKPGDFSTFWKTISDELAGMAAAPTVEEIPLRSTDFATAYSVHLTSIGPYRIFAYLSIPHGSGPFPARYSLPRYGSVVEPINQGQANSQREDYVTFSLGARGQRGADWPFAASFPGLLTHDIDDPWTYPFRGIVADCCRGLEYLTGLPEVDGSRVAAIGNDLAFITAALCPLITLVVCTPALFYAASDLAPRTEAYPLEEINDYLRSNPSKRDAVCRTLSYFDLRWMADRVKATILLMAGSDGGLLDGETLEPLLDSLDGRVELHKEEHSTYKDGLFIEQWLTSQFDLPTMRLPEAWQ